MNIRQRRTFRWMGISLLLGIGFWLWSDSEETAPDLTYIFAGVENANVQRLEIHSADTTMSLIRTQEQWEVVGSNTFEVEYAAVEGMLTKLLHATRSKPLDVADSEPFGLQPAQVSLTLFEADNTAHRLDIGNPLHVSTDSYIRHQSEIYTTAGRLAEDWHGFKMRLQAEQTKAATHH